MIENERQIAFIGYGGMLMESFVAIMAMIGASIIHPGVYFAMNSSAGLIGTTAEQAAQVISGWGFADSVSWAFVSSARRLSLSALSSFVASMSSGTNFV
jgi:carbon starvation protein CstA